MIGVDTERYASKIKMKKFGFDEYLESRTFTSHENKFGFI